MADLRPFRLDLLDDFAGRAVLASVPLCFPGLLTTPPESVAVPRFADVDGPFNASPFLSAMRRENRRGLEELALVTSFCCSCLTQVLA